MAGGETSVCLNAQFTSSLSYWSRWSGFVTVTIEIVVETSIRPTVWFCGCSRWGVFSVTADGAQAGSTQTHKRRHGGRSYVIRKCSAYVKPSSNRIFIAFTWQTFDRFITISNHNELSIEWRYFQLKYICQKLFGTANTLHHIEIYEHKSKYSTNNTLSKQVNVTVLVFQKRLFSIGYIEPFSFIHE